MKVQKGVVFTDEQNQQQTTQQPRQFIVERTERKELPLSPKNVHIMTNGTIPQGPMNQRNSQDEKIVQENDQKNNTQFLQVPIQSGVTSPEEGYTSGLKKELQDHKSQGQKDIAEIAKLEGTEEAVKQTVIETERHKERLNDLVDNAQNILLKIKTVFPFDLFPDDITIDPIKITIAYRMMFGSTSMRSIVLNEITNVEVGTTPFFSMLRIINSKEKLPVVIKPLKKADALRAANILQGLLFAQKQNIDITRIPKEDAIGKIETLGKSHIAV